MNVNRTEWGGIHIQARYDISDELTEINQSIDGGAFKDSSVLITGGAGFLGTWLCHVLIGQGANVTCLDNLSSGLRENIANLEHNPRFTFIQHDISKPITFRKKFDYVMHLASRASPLEFENHSLEIIRANTIGTTNALDIATAHEAKFLFTSTSEIYGNPGIFPTPETCNGNVSTDGIRGCYTESKRMGETLCLAYLREYGTDVRIARIFNTYGPLMRADGEYGRVIPRFITQAMKGEPITIFGDGSQTRCFCYVTDQIGGLLRLLTCNSANGQVINIGNNREISILELANLVKKLTYSHSKMTFSNIPDGDPLRRLPNITKAEQFLGWRPRVQLDEGLENFSKFFRCQNQHATSSFSPESRVTQTHFDSNLKKSHVQTR